MSGPRLGPALIALTAGTLLRLCREGMVVRALAWPGLLASVALVASAGAVGVLAGGDDVVIPTDMPGLARALEEVGLEVTEAARPLEASGLAIAADGEGWVIRTTRPGPANLAAEAALREVVGAAWVPVAAPLPARTADLDRTTGWIAGLVDLLFALYGVVLGAGTVLRDREEGVLEAELALPVPAWLHGASRLLASCLALGLGLAATLLLLDALVGITGLGGWLLQGLAASVGGVALGLYAMRTPGASFSGPASRALGLCLGLVGAGMTLPVVGATLPVASVSALLAGGAPGLAPLGLACLASVGAVWAFGRGARA